MYDSTKRPVWWVFSGMGSQWPGMGRDLLEVPVFAAAIDECDRVLRPLGLDLLDILTNDAPSVFDNILHSFVGIAAIQIGLVDILRAVGVTPDGILGLSLGELCCAYADQCLSVKETILGAYASGRAILEANVVSAQMAAIGLGYNDIKDHLPDSIDVICHNSSDCCTISGPTEDILKYVAEIKEQGVFAKTVNAGGIAYHSRYIKTIGPKLLEYLKETISEPKRRSARWISSSVPQSWWGHADAVLCSAEYHTNNLLNPVLFEEACQYIPKTAIIIEIAPRGLLQSILRRSMGLGFMNISLTSMNSESNRMHLLNALEELSLNNVFIDIDALYVFIDINALYPAVEYPVSRGTPSLAPLVTRDDSDVCYKEYSAKLANDEGGSKMKSLESASRELVPGLPQFVSLLGSGCAVSEQRAASGLPVCAVRSNSTLHSLTHVLPHLSGILAENHTASRFFTYEDITTTASTSETRGNDYQSYLPATLVELGVLDERDFVFQVVATCSCHLCYVRHTMLTVFLVSGLGVQDIQPLTSQLAHPAFVATPPTTSTLSVEKYAELLVQEVMKIQAKGPYNIMGVSWGGAAALELGGLMESGPPCGVGAAGSGPASLTGRVEALWNLYQSDLPSSLLACLLHLTFCKLSPKIIVTGNDSYKQLIADFNTAFIINENMAYDINM